MTPEEEMYRQAMVRQNTALILLADAVVDCGEDVAMAVCSALRRRMVAEHVEHLDDFSRAMDVLEVATRRDEM